MNAAQKLIGNNGGKPAENKTADPDGMDKYKTVLMVYFDDCPDLLEYIDAQAKKELRPPDNWLKVLAFRHRESNPETAPAPQKRKSPRKKAAKPEVNNEQR